jgi:aromatic-L-amino-acid decarboxylase
MDTLELSEKQIRDMAMRLGETLVEYQATLAERPVFPDVDIDALNAIANASLPQEGEPLDALVDEFNRVIVPNSLHIAHPRFLAYVTASPAGIAPFAEAYTAMINQNCAIWQGGPAANAVERCVLGWLASLFNLPSDTPGILVSGGSMANLVALTAARDASIPGHSTADGIQSVSHPLTVYVSDEVHSSVYKAANMLGIGERFVRTIPVDDAFRMRVDKLSEAIAADRANGFHPGIVIASPGAVQTGAFDPIDAIADLCEREDMWLHADGAYGALGILAERLRPELGSLHRADSLTMDPHKLLFSSNEAGCALVPRPGALYAAFGHQSKYIGQEEIPGFIDFKDFGPQLTRQFRALKVWWIFRAYGMTLLRQTVNRLLDLAQYLGEALEEDRSIELAIKPTLTAVCFRVREWDDEKNAALLSALIKSGVVYFGPAVLRGKFYIRACFTSYRTTEADVDMVMDAIRREREQLGA